MRRYVASVFLLCLALILSGCGGDARAPFDATVTGPADGDFTVNPPGGGTHIVQAIDFQVRDSTGSIALPGVEVELFAGGGGILTDLDGNPLDPNNPTYFKTETDDLGLVRASFLISLPDCSSEELIVDGTVNATAGGASEQWTGTFTIKSCST